MTIKTTEIIPFDTHLSSWNKYKIQEHKNKKQNRKKVVDTSETAESSFQRIKHLDCEDSCSSSSIPSK